LRAQKKDERKKKMNKSTIHIPLENLKRVSFACDHCHATITVDISNPEQKKTIGAAGQQACPICLYRMKPDIFLALGVYVQWFNQATAANQKVEFIIDRDSN
jgi:hypothetical protein